MGNTAEGILKMAESKQLDPEDIAVNALLVQGR